VSSNIRHGHSSSKVDRSPASLAAQVGRATTSGKDGNLLTFTEVQSKDRAEQLHDVEGWGAYTPHTETDCAVMWDKAEFTKVAVFTNRLGSKTFIDGNGNAKKIICATVVLDHKPTWQRLWVSVAHLPSSVQDGDHFSKAQTDKDRVAAWKSAVDDWTVTRQNQRDKYEQDRSMHVADWNVNFRMPEWRTEVDNRIAPKDPDTFRGTWVPANMPAGGTLGDRLIDATWTNGTFKDTFLLPDDDSSDHRPYGDVIAW
jgi:hypothetical protein